MSRYAAQTQVTNHLGIQTRTQVPICRRYAAWTQVTIHLRIPARTQVCTSFYCWFVLIVNHSVLAFFLILKNRQDSYIFCHCFSLNSGSRSIAVYFVIRWCPGHPCFYIESSFIGTVQHGFAPDSSCGSETVVQFGSICHHSTQICTKLWCRAIAQ